MNNPGRIVIGLVGLGAMALIAGGCPPSYPDCDGDKHCASHGEVCVDNQCHQCRDDSQCSKLDSCMVCQANECVKQAGCCKSDLDCPAGRCVDGMCGAECEVNSDCPGQERCVNGKCTDRAGCDDDSQCPTGLSCQDGVCSPSSCEIEPILFDFNEYTIRLDQEPLLQANADCLKRSPQVTVHVEGHCDERGSDEYNLTLGQRRANSVARIYKQLGVGHLAPTLSWGEEKPVCSGSGESCWRKNRRAETITR